MLPPGEQQDRRASLIWSTAVFKNKAIYDIWYDMIWYDMIWYDMIWYDMILFAQKSRPYGRITMYNIRQEKKKKTQYDQKQS